MNPFEFIVLWRDLCWKLAKRPNKEAGPFFIVVLACIENMHLAFLCHYDRACIVMPSDLSGGHDGNCIIKKPGLCVTTKPVPRIVRRAYHTVYGYLTTAVSGSNKNIYFFKHFQCDRKLNLFQPHILKRRVIPNQTVA